jgi:hypothetical protein
LAYFRRTHQIDGNLVCSKHKSLLQVCDASGIKNNIFYDINKFNTNNSKTNISNEIIEVLYNLSCDIDSLICKYEHLPNYSITREKYYSKIADLGYLSKGGLVNQIKLYKDFINYYPKGLLEILKSNVDINSERSWLRLITRKNEITVHPIRNLLFIRFLFGDFNNFINYTEYKALCTKEIRCKSNLQVKSEKEYDINLEEPYKKKLLSLIKEEANVSRKEISKRLRKEYIWLFKHESDWLESVLPTSQKYKDFYKKDRVDWNDRDLKHSIKVKEAIDNILINEVLDRINIHQISKKISYKSLYRSLDKMPKTKALIEYYSESIPEFHKRKIRIVLRKLIRYNKEITLNIILRKAFISYKYYHDYDEFINRLLDSSIIN